MNLEHENIESYRNSRLIEALLFYNGDSMNISTISKVSGLNNVEIEEALKVLKSSIKNRGVILVEWQGEYTLTTAPEFSEYIERWRADELTKDIGPAGLEVLAILIYRGPASKTDIQFIRGVNSQSTLNNLIARGLIQKSGTPAIYGVTIETLKYLGITDPNNIPEYEDIRKALNAIPCA